MQPVRASEPSNTYSNRIWLSPAGDRKPAYPREDAASTPYRASVPACPVHGTGAKLSRHGQSSVALTLVTHAHTDVHEELEKAFLIFQHVAPERRVIQRDRAV